MVTASSKRLPMSTIHNDVTVSNYALSIIGIWLPSTSSTTFDTPCRSLHDTASSEVCEAIPLIAALSYPAPSRISQGSLHERGGEPLLCTSFAKAQKMPARTKKPKQKDAVKPKEVPSVAATPTLQQPPQEPDVPLQQHVHLSPAAVTPRPSVIRRLLPPQACLYYNCEIC